MSWCDLDLTFNLAVVTFTYEILSGYISLRCRKNYLVGILLRVVGVQHHDVTLI